MTEKTRLLFGKKTIRDVEVHGKKILLRVDFNVPLSKSDNTISSDYRIIQALPTIEYLLKRNCKIVIVSHLGRPDGKRDQTLSLEPIASYLEKLVKVPVAFVPEAITDVTVQALKNLQPGSIAMLENIRFYKQEEDNDKNFAKKLIEIIKPDFVVHDEFGAIHRAHASTEGVSHLVPSVAGLLLEKEVVTLLSVTTNPARPLVAILGGAKISDKLPLVSRFIDSADQILLGGAMANNFIKSQGNEVGDSLVDTDGDLAVEQILKKSKEGQLSVPIDVAVSTHISKDADRRDCKVDEVKSNEIILDLGFDTMRQYVSSVDKASTVIWNGNLGMTELSKFAQATTILTETLSNLTGQAKTIIGGGDTADFVIDWLKDHPEGKFSHISTGGGASLELLSGKKLPGIEALMDV